MKAYGIDREDRDFCCPGHEKFPRGSYNSNRSKRAHRRATRVAHKRARARLHKEIQAELSYGEP